MSNTNFRVKPYIIVLLVALLAVALTAVILLYQKQQPAYGGLPYDIRYGVKIASGSMEKAADKRRNDYLEKAIVLRSKLEPWSRGHKDLINAMLASDGKNTVALDAVYQAVPGRKKLLGITAQDTHFGDPRDPSSNAFTWNAIKTNDAPGTAGYKGAVGYKALMLRDFTKHSDYVITQTLGVGRAEIFLWSSGRITEKVMPLMPDDSAGPVEREIMPPFDFLTAPTFK